MVRFIPTADEKWSVFLAGRINKNGLLAHGHSMFRDIHACSGRQIVGILG